MNKSTVIGTIAGMAVGIWVTTIASSPSKRAEWHIESYKQGRKDALAVKGSNGQLNWELEQTCVGLWAHGLETKGEKK